MTPVTLDSTTVEETQISTSITPLFKEDKPNIERDLVQVFKLLADETRLRILMYLMKEAEINVTTLCDRLGQSQPAVSHHLALLRVSGLIQPRRDGKHNYYSVRQDRFHDVMAALFNAMKNENIQK
jgi:ArsR family transcriptional regulator